MIGPRWGAMRVLAPDLRIQGVQLECIREALCARLEAPLVADAMHLVDGAGIQGRRRKRVLDSILRDRLASAQIDGCWLVRPSSADLAAQAREARLLPRLGIFLAAHLSEYLLALACWMVIGRTALEGRPDPGWLAAWALLLLTRIPLRMLASWMQGSLALRAAAIFKARLLAGTLKLQPEEIRNQGTGQLLGRVIESEALESLALNGGLAGLLAVLEIGVVVVVLVFGADSIALAAGLFGWTALC